MGLSKAQTKKMRILILNARYAPEGIGGPAHTARFLAEQLVVMGHEVTVFCRTQKGGVIEEDLAGVQVVRVGLNFPRDALLATFEKTLEEYRPELIHSLFPREFPMWDLPGIASSRGIRLVHTLLEFNLLCPTSFMRGGRPCKTQCDDCRVATAPSRGFADSVDGVVGISRYMLDLHQRMGLFRNTPVQSVIHDAYEPLHSTAVRHSVSGPMRLGFLGRVEPNKGLEMLLDTLTTTLSGRDWTLAVAGKGAPAYETSLRQKYRDERIRFLGFVEQGLLLGAIDMLVVPSIWDEPLGRIVFEAYAHGVPVIVSKRGGLPEMVEPGETGLLFNPDTPGALANAIEDMMRHPDRLEEMSSKARLKWEKEFTPEAIARQYLSVYARVLGESDPA